MGTKIINVNVGVLGHVDSGKTSLVKALSEELSTAALDKHPESKKRGITLDLGFSAFMAEVPRSLADSGYDRVQYTLVDCPGHASLIRTIIGGAQIIDMMLLVIDVTKGIQTQTAECLVIGEITTDKMIVVLNKADLFSDSEREQKIAKAKAKIATVLASTKFKDAPMVVVSAAPGGAGKEGAASTSDTNRTAEGIDRLLDAISANVELPQRSNKGPFLFAIDHCFPIKGQGTVMTGTVLGGSVKLNDTIDLPALGKQFKVKSMQMFKKPVQSAQQGDRVGICVAGLDAKAIERGIAASPGYVQPLTSVIALVRKIRFFRGLATSGAKFHVTVGHSTVMATAVFFGAMELASEGIPTPSAAMGSSDAPAAAADASASSAELEGQAQLHASTGVPICSYDWAREYLWQPELMGPGKKKKGEGEAAPGPQPEWQWAVLHLETPVLSPVNSLVIGSHLDTDITANVCRLGFFGRITEVLPDASPQTMAKLHLYKPKEKRGVVERVESNDASGVAVIGKNLFKKETNITPFIGCKISTSSGSIGTIDAGFGKSGKFRALFPAGTNINARDELILHFKKYMYAHDKVIKQ